MDISIKDVSNPVGTPIEDEAIENFVTVMAAVWEEEKETSPWWKFWNKISFTRVTIFLTKALDDLIAYVDDYIDANGADKKATVLSAISKLYDYIVVQAMPIYLKPFSSSIKSFIINDLIATSIDWIVDKYRNGEWRKKGAEEVKALWALKAQSIGVPFGGTLPQ